MVNKKRLSRMNPYRKYSKRIISPHPNYSFWDFILLIFSLLFLTLFLISLYDKFLARSDFFTEYKKYYIVTYYFVVAAISIGFIWCSRFIFLRKGFLWLAESLKLILPKGKSLWDLMSLFGGAALLGTVGGIIGFFVTTSNQENAIKLQNEQEQQALLTNYIQDMSKLIEEDTKFSQPNGTNPNSLIKRPEMKIAIKARTLNTLEKLNGDKSRQAYALRFAIRAFPDFSCPDQGDSIFCRIPDNIHLEGIDLSGFAIEKGSKINAFFQGVNLKSSNLQGSEFQEASLVGTQFINADLTNVKFNKNTKLDGASFKDAKLFNISLEDVNLEYSRELNKAKFYKTGFNEMTSFPKDFDVCSFIQTTSKRGLEYRFPIILLQDEANQRNTKSELKEFYKLYTQYYNYDRDKKQYVKPISLNDNVVDKFNNQLQELYSKKEGKRKSKCEKDIAFG